MGKYTSAKKPSHNNYTQQMAVPDRDVQGVFTPTDPIISNNDALEVINENIIVLSDAEDHKNVVVLPALKSYFTEKSIEKEFDTKIWQMLTPENPPPGFEENADGTFEEVPQPPFEKPLSLFFRARNYRWCVSDGVRVADRWDGHEPWTPAGKESKGHMANPLGNVTLLYAPDDHAVFYPREVVNYIKDDGNPTRQGLTWEWKLDGNVVSTGPSATINNLRSQGEKWKEVSTPHKIVCKVSNEHGFVQEEMSFVVADDIIDGDGFNYKQRNKGWYEFQEDEYWNHGTEPVDFIDDPRFAPRTLTIKKINFSGYGNGHSGEANFKKDPGDGDWKQEAQFRVNGGPWQLARDVFAGKDKPWRAYRFQTNDSRDKIVTTQAGGSEAFIEFRYKYRYYTGGFLGLGRRKWHRKYAGSYTWQAPTDNSTFNVVLDSWTINYTNELKG